MKKVIDNDGNEVSVSDDTVVSSVDGVDYLLTPEQETKMQEAIAEAESAAPQVAKDNAFRALKEYYKSDDVRFVIYNNHLVKLNEGSLAGTDGKRTRLKDNGDKTEDLWYYDDGSSELLDLNGFTNLNNLLWDTDQNLRDIRQAHKEAIEALTTVAEIEAYDFTADINGLSWV